MKIGDLVVRLNRLTFGGRGPRHLGVVIGEGLFGDPRTGRVDKAFRVAWTSGSSSQVKPSWVKPYEGDAGKNDKDIK